LNVKRPEAPALWLGLAVCAWLLIAAHIAGAFPWSIDMFRGEAIQPLSRAPRNMPSGTLAIDGVPPMTREVAAVTLRNPLKPTPEVLAAGKDLFETDCAVCHNSDGRGGGPVGFLLRLPPADLTRGVAAQRTDGYIYATIRNGSFVMPGYGDAMSSHERWEVVLYVRSLQQQAGAMPAVQQQASPIRPVQQKVSAK
jgi:mono/diheme cytochrome c family protein